MYLKYIHVYVSKIIEIKLKLPEKFFSLSGITKKLGVAKFIKESFINKPELAVPLVGFPLCK